MSAWHLENYRPFLRLQAHGLSFGQRLLRRFDESDIVQQTMLKAHEGLADFRGTTEAELIAWLQAAMGNILKDFARREQADKRDVRREKEIEVAVGASSVRMDRFIAAAGETPSVALRREELMARVASAIDQLEPDQRDAIVLREMNGMPVAEIAAKLNRTEKSVAGLLLRGRKRMRELLMEYDGG